MESIFFVGSAVAMDARWCFTKVPISANPFFPSASPVPSPSALHAVPCCRATSSGDFVRRRCRRLASDQHYALPPSTTGIRTTIPIPGDAKEFRHFKNCSGRETPRTLDTGNSSHLMKRIFDICKKSRSCETQSSKQNLSTLFNLRKALEFAFLTGLFTFQASQQAIAGMEIAGGQPMSYLGDLGDISTGFASAFLLIFFSELGDKTFFIAALLAARNSGVIVFLGTFGALAAMSIVSVVLGRTFHYIDDALPFRFGGTDFPIDDFAAVCLLVYFGVTTLLDAASDDGKATEEQKEAELAISEFSGNGAGIMAAASTVVTTFVLVFVAEWGDKSFFSTIALAAASSPLGVIAGAFAGHAVATLLAVLGGSLLGTFLSEKVIAYVGGTLFLVFAAVTLIEIIY